jgi:glycine cleavage system H protein
MIPDDLKYAASHEWARITGGEAVIGVTHFAQEQLGDITFIDLPQPGTKVKAGMEFGVIESVKAASDLYSPVTGEIVAVNEALADDPAAVNRDVYGEGWLVRIILTAPVENLLTPAEYADIAKPA